MSDIIMTERAYTMDLSKILKDGENIIQLIATEGLPLIVVTNKKMYQILIGSGISMKTGKRYETANQIAEVFNFSVDSLIFQNTYKIVQNSDKKELKILTYSLMTKFDSLLNIYNYLQNDWDKIYAEFMKNRKEYENLSRALPQIPLLKEFFDAFCMEAKDAISYFLALFKVYYMGLNMKAPPVSATKCVDFIKKYNLLDLKDIFDKLHKIDEEFRHIRNAIVHVEDYKNNNFSLYNVHLEANNVLTPPFFEYKNNENSGSGFALEYINAIYESLLEISKEFLMFLVR